MLELFHEQGSSFTAAGRVDGLAAEKTAEPASQITFSPKSFGMAEDG